MIALTRYPRLRALSCSVLALALVTTHLPAISATALANQPIFSTSEVPGNLALSLSVEYPTATRVAHVADYTSTRNFLGYFDPLKCYEYKKNTTQVTTDGGTVIPLDKGDSSYFQPVSVTTNRICNGKWSGNFLNWATLTAIDPFRWAMTGGRRVVDTPTETIVEKGWHSGQGSYFPERNQDARTEGRLPLTEAAGATPFANAKTMRVIVNGRGFAMQLVTTNGVRGQYYAGVSQTPTPDTLRWTNSNDTIDNSWGSKTGPGNGVPNDNFTAIYTYSGIAPATGTYKFQTYADDGVVLKVNGTLLIDDWTSHGAENREGTISLVAGQSYDLELKYFDQTGSAVIRLNWQPPGQNNYSLFSSAVGAASTQNYTMRAKVCDATVGLEANCKQYRDGWKPEGLIQQYADKMRFSALGYLNDSNEYRDGGVLRARQKFVGPTHPEPGQAPRDNTNKEWAADTGQMVRNPDAADATATTAASATEVTERVTIADSGVMNYLNKFGQLIPGDYKGIDPVNELYYAALRYFRGLESVPSWTSMAGASKATKTTYLDGFPAITDWRAADPVQYSCQRNFVLGIGDIYTHRDKNVPGNSLTDHEPTMPTEVSADTMFDAVKSTNNAKFLQGMGTGKATAATGSSYSTDYMAGLAFEANTKDIRPDLIGKQTVQTYWVDVLEQPFSRNNKFYLAAKFGGLNQKKLPADFDPYTFAGTIPLDWWSTSGDTLTDARNTPVTVPRPDNYFAAGQPDTMVAGLKQAFERISNEISAYTTSFSLSSAQVSSTGAASYAAQYDSKNWTGLLSASRLTFDSSGNPSATLVWESKTKLEAQLAGTGWNDSRNIVTRGATAGVPFRYASLSADHQALLNTSYVTDNDAENYVNWLRGDRANERTATDASKAYRQRDLLLGDIVNAKVTPAGPPALPYSDSVNPGYAAFKTTWRNRPVMVYAGANDGMVHAFNGALTGTDAGKEQFAYVPSFLFAKAASSDADGLLSQLGNPYYQHRFFVDATPSTFDIDFNSAGGTFTTTSAATSDWRTVLIGGLGKGGKGFYALDVTNPAGMNTETNVASKVLWEFTDADMGYSFGAPVVVKTRKHGWVVIFTSGYNGGGTSSHLYIVNPTNGQLIQKISTPTASEGMAQASAYVQDFSDGTADAVYAGDLNGQLWRFDLTAARAATTSYPAPTLIANLTDGATTPQAQPITTQPLIEIQPLTKKRYVLVGTGRLLDASDIQSAQEQSYYALIDGTASAFTPVSTGNFPIARSNLQAVTDLTQGIALTATSRGWYTDLGVTNRVGWRAVNASTSYSGVVAFSTLQTAGDACAPSGTSRVYAIDFGTGRSALVDANGNLIAYAASGAAVNDVRFLGVDGSTRLVSGDVKGNMQNNPIKLPGALGLRLLNWREVPTVD